MLKKNILRALSDEYSKNMIACTITEGKSVKQMSESCTIPLNTAYRRARELVSEGLLLVEQTILTNDGAKYHIYRSSLRSVNVQWSPPDEVKMEFAPVEDVIDKFLRLWNSIMRGRRPEL